MISIKEEVISTMSSSDLADILFDKKKELREYWEGFDKLYLSLLKGMSDTDQQFLFEIYETSKEKVLLEKTIKMIEWEIKKKQHGYRDKKVDIEALKQTIPIRDIISSCVNITNVRRGQNIKCPLPDHTDGTASFHIYDNSNSWKCFGCNRGGSQIDFLMHYYGVDVKKAINLFSKF